ncbi:BAG family molecular chaperone regulator 5, mitochondrial isoform X1 [Nicotiana sylvestris]|uniref:BAG family molecular chaperone regulator 5, mitochondrial isoform X1 n=1 Tax=Nicotiana sylvestris TaxID=4096 RepID=A0A1U7Y032_NICSY|nr:PREDICTED: BAG family molecular chaperone regulator 5, mitochondrial isoform X1 [Nicotiana sylvestris]
MKSCRRSSFYSSSSSSSTVTCFMENDQSTPEIIQIPIQSPPENELPNLSAPTGTAAVKIQSAYRSYVVRTLVKKISAVNSEANYLQRLIQRQQDTVDAVRSSERERIRMNEALMGLLLRLDSVPGVDSTVRELRRHVSRRIVGLQEILDAVSDTKIQNWDGFLMDWDDVVERMEIEVCKERGDNELETFCAEHLGFRCLQRFLRDQ